MSDTIKFRGYCDVLGSIYHTGMHHKDIHCVNWRELLPPAPEQPQLGTCPSIPHITHNKCGNVDWTPISTSAQPAKVSDTKQFGMCDYRASGHSKLYLGPHVRQPECVDWKPLSAAAPPEQPRETKKCEHCRGEGRITFTQGFGDYRTCEACTGTGKLPAPAAQQDEPDWDAIKKSESAQEGQPAEVSTGYTNGLCYEPLVSRKGEDARTDRCMLKGGHKGNHYWIVDGWRVETPQRGFIPVDTQMEKTQPEQVSERVKEQVRGLIREVGIPYKSADDYYDRNLPDREALENQLMEGLAPLLAELASLREHLSGQRMILNGIISASRDYSERNNLPGKPVWQNMAEEALEILKLAALSPSGDFTNRG